MIIWYNPKKRGQIVKFIIDNKISGFDLRPLDPKSKGGIALWNFNPYADGFDSKMEDNLFINFCLDNDIKVVWDHGFETIFPSLENEFLNLNKQFIIANNIKILTNCDIRFLDRINPRDKVDWELANQIIDADFFPYHTRLHTVQSCNNDFHWNTYPVPVDQKQYRWSACIGDIKKSINIFIAGVLDQHNGGWTSKIYDGGKPNWPVDWYHDGDLIAYINNNFNDIVKHDPFDDVGPELHMYRTFVERRVPQQIYDSLFNIIVETLYSPQFYTEKSYKGLLAKVPFIFSVPSYNSVFSEKYGYELYDEIFDYSFDTDPKRKDIRSIILNLQDILTHTDKLDKSVFEQKSVKEKTEYNYNRFMQLTHKQAFINHMNEVLDALSS